MINIFDGKVLDFWGGLVDLKERKIKMIDKDTFMQDSLRVLRAIGFASRFNFHIEEQTLKTMKNMPIYDLSKDRIKTEIIKFFKSYHLDVGLKYMHNLGLIKEIFGINLNNDEIDKFCKFMMPKIKFCIKNKTYNEYLFLYLFCGFFNLNIKNILEQLNLNSSYRQVIKQPFYGKITKTNMLEISLKLPLKDWFGIYSDNRLKLAKKMNIYNHKFDTNIDIQMLINSGFSGKQLAQELKKQQNLAIKDYLKANF